MRPRLGLALAVFLVVLALPGRAENPAEPAQESKDLCSYLKDVEAKPDSACAPGALLALKTQDPNGFGEKLALAAKRKADVQKAFDRLKASTGKAAPDLPRLEPPINERTFPAWLGDKALDLKPVYAHLLEAQKKQLEQQMAAEPSPEKRAEIERALASNQAKIASLDRIKDPSQLSCFLGDTCGNRGDVTGPGGQIVGGSRGAWTQADFEKANAAAQRERAVPGGRIESEVPELANDANPTDQKSSSNKASPLLPISIPLGLGLVGYGVYRSRKKDETTLGTVSSDSVYKPTLSSDPVGVIADYAFRAKIAIEDHPLATLGTIGAVAMGGLYFGGPMLMGSGAGEMIIGGSGGAALAPAAATVAAPAAGATLAPAGTAAAAGTLLLMSGDRHGETSREGASNESQGVPERKKAPDFHPDKSDHIFGDRPGHLPDTPENRQLLRDTAFDSKNFVGMDKYGKQWYARLLSNGKQVWVEVWKDGTIRNAGLNETPRVLPPK